MRDWEHRLLEQGEAAVRKHLDFYYPSHTETLLALITEGWRPPPPEDAVERASEYIERATAGLPVIKPLSGEYVSIPVPPADELVERVAKALYEQEYQPCGGIPRVEFADAGDEVRAAWTDRAATAVRALGEGVNG